jgi:mannose-6-phosphate isomerase-like protein (cupin superfamily)
MDGSPRQVFDNPVTGEHVVLLTDPRTHPDEVLVAHLFVAPGGRVAAPHLHPTITERFYVTKGRVGFMIGEDERVLGPGQGATVPPGTVHDWWQVGDEVAEVVVEVLPGVRFTEMVGSMFGLARDGKVSAEGMPDPLQLAVMGSEYGDVIRFTSPPAIVQRLTIPPLALVGRLMGKRPMYEQYVTVEETEDPDPEALALLTEDGRLREFEEVPA